MSTPFSSKEVAHLPSEMKFIGKQKCSSPTRSSLLAWPGAPRVAAEKTFIASRRLCRGGPISNFLDVEDAVSHVPNRHLSELYRLVAAASSSSGWFAELAFRCLRTICEKEWLHLVPDLASGSPTKLCEVIDLTGVVHCKGVWVGHLVDSD